MDDLLDNQMIYLNIETMDIFAVVDAFASRWELFLREQVLTRSFVELDLRVHLVINI